MSRLSAWPFRAACGQSRRRRSDTNNHLCVAPWCREAYSARVALRWAGCPPQHLRAQRGDDLGTGHWALDDLGSPAIPAWRPGVVADAHTVYASAAPPRPTAISNCMGMLRRACGQIELVCCLFLLHATCGGSALHSNQLGHLGRYARELEPGTRVDKAEGPGWARVSTRRQQSSARVPGVCLQVQSGSNRHIEPLHLPADPRPAFSYTHASSVFEITHTRSTRSSHQHSAVAASELAAAASACGGALGFAKVAL
jgi:hypothetical protein